MYASLHNHTYYSIQDGFASPKEYMERANEVGINAICLTEHGNVYSAPYVFKLKSEYPNIKILYGVEAYECFDHTEKDPDNKYFHLVIIAKNERGRVAVNKLITASEFEGKYYKPRVDLEMMKPYAKDIIVTSACMASKLNRVKDYNKCVEYVNEYKSIFGENFFLELQSHRSNDQYEYNNKVLKLAKETDTPFIITTDSHAATKEQLEFQGIFVQIAHDAETASESYEGCYMQSENEIHEIMDEQIGWEHVVLGLETTNYLADMCEDVNVPFQEPKLPPFPIPTGYTERSYMEMLLEQGWKNRNFDALSNEEQQIRMERINYELDVIDKMGFIGYFLIVWDFMNWGRQNGVLFGDGGRGSGAGSIVCYLLGLTGVDPVRYNLIFQRFLNPERVGMPDLDIDLQPRDKVISYLQERYGEMYVCQVCNFSYLTPTVAIKDVARILDKDEKRFEKFGRKIGTQKSFEIAKLFNFEKWEDCIEANKSAIKNYSEPIYNDLFRIAKEISGRVRHVSIHAGGVCIGEEIIDSYMPMKLTDKNEHVIMADKKMVEAIGLVKFDLLGLGTLGIIKNALLYGNIDHWDIDPNNEVFLNDTKMYDMIATGDTTNVFQIESQGMKDLCKQIKPKSLEEISDILALYRPDVMQAGMLDDYINRKVNGAEVKYIHPDMEKILGQTFGVTLYQEQSMEITRVFGGRSMAGADTLRKILGKKMVDKVKPEIAKLRKEIIDNGYSKEVSNYICDQMEGMGNYSFNKSHSMGYGVITLQTAYLKSHYPVEFYCAVLNNANGDNSKINKYILEAQKHGVEILPPHINYSNDEFTVVNGKVLFGINAINALGNIQVSKIIAERNEHGKYNGIKDLIERVEITSAQVVALIKAGAFGNEKDALLEKYLKYETVKKIPSEYKEYKPVKTIPSLLVLKTEWGIDTDIVKDKQERIRLFNEAKKLKHDTIDYEEWKKNLSAKRKSEYESLYEKYCDNREFWEFEALSVFLSNNPFKEYAEYLTTSMTKREIGETICDVGIISQITKKKDRNKHTYCYINLYTFDGLVEGICWASTYEKYINLISKGNKVFVAGRKEKEDLLSVNDIKTIEEWVRDYHINLKG